MNTALRLLSSSLALPPSNTPDLVKEIIARGHEVAGHGYMHLRPAELTLEEEIEDLDRGLEALEKAAGQKITGYRVPGGDASDRTMYPPRRARRRLRLQPHGRRRPRT